MAFNRNKTWDYFILVCRVLLGFIFISYGFSKLAGNQFGITEIEMTKTVKETDLFRLSWYLFSHEPFNTFVGISQIISGAFLLYNRTALFGALMLLPIVLNILIIDITFVKIPGFYTRLSAYIVLILLILFHYRKQMYEALILLSKNIKPKFKYPLWAILLLPVFAFILEFVLALPRVIYYFIVSPEKSINSFLNFFEKF